MRSEQAMYDLILGIAKADYRVRAVLLNGSRANPLAHKDCFQDFDIVYIVQDMNTFLEDHDWIKVYGEAMIVQIPEAMQLLPPCGDGRFTYLIQLMDGNRVDLTLIPIEKHKDLLGSDSLTVLLLDKDDLLGPFDTPSDKDYWIQPPTSRTYENCCNEFWWIAPYVAKGLWRREISVAKGFHDHHLRAMLDQMFKWYVGCTQGFEINLGKFNKHLPQYISEDMWRSYLATYSAADPEAIWDSLEESMRLFRQTAQVVAQVLTYDYLHAEDQKVSQFLKHIRQLPYDAQSI